MTESVRGHRKTIEVRALMVGRLVRRLLREETGQDLIEYALLTATIGLASVAAWSAIGPVISGAYTNWNNNLYNLWESPDPS